MNKHYVCLIYTGRNVPSYFCRAMNALRWAILERDEIGLYENQEDFMEAADLVVAVIDHQSETLVKKIKRRVALGKPILYFVHEDLDLPTCISEEFRNAMPVEVLSSVRRYRNNSDLLLEIIRSSKVGQEVVPAHTRG